MQNIKIKKTQLQSQTIFKSVLFNKDISLRKEFFNLLSELCGGTILGLACYKIFFIYNKQAMFVLLSIGFLGGFYSYISRLVIKKIKK